MQTASEQLRNDSNGHGKLDSKKQEHASSNKMHNCHFNYARMRLPRMVVHGPQLIHTHRRKKDNTNRGGGRERCNIRVHDVMTYSATTSTKTCSVELSVMSSRSRLSRGDLGRSGPAPLVAMAAVLRMELRGRRGQLNLSESSIVLQARIRLSAKTHPQFDKKFVDSIRMVTE